MFTDNPNKALIRSSFDRQAIAMDYRRAGRPLDYFGLPGPEMLDVQDWSDFLGKIVAVERNPDDLRVMEFGAFAYGMLSRTQLLSGDVDDAIISGADENGEKLWIEAFDVVNLDYYSGIVVKELQGGAKHLKAIRELVRKQEIGVKSFRLFITCNARNKDKGELDQVIAQLGDDLRGLGRDPTENVKWYEAGGVDQKLKVWVPLLLHQYAAPCRFSLEDYKVVSYSGTSGSRMVHFSLRFQFSEDQLNVKRPRLDILLGAPLYEVLDGRIVPSLRVAPPIR